MIMKLAPLGAFLAMAYTVGTFGLKTLLPLFRLMGDVYLTMFLFIFVVLNLIARYWGFSLWAFLKFIREELLITLGTSRSEAALPGMMAKLERYGCSRPVVGLVIPTGYSFNLDGTSIYLTMATIFLAQVYGKQLGLGEQLEGVALLLGVDRFMSEARAITNLIGNGVATLVISRSEGAFDDAMRERAVAEQAAERAAA